MTENNVRKTGQKIHGKRLLPYDTDDLAGNSWFTLKIHLIEIFTHNINTHDIITSFKQDYCLFVILRIIGL